MYVSIFTLNLLQNLTVDQSKVAFASCRAVLSLKRSLNIRQKKLNQADDVNLVVRVASLIGCFSVLNFRAQVSTNQRQLTSSSVEFFRSYFRRLLSGEGTKLVTMTTKKLERTLTSCRKFIASDV